MQCQNSDTSYLYELIAFGSSGIKFNGNTYSSAGGEDFLFVMYDKNGNIMLEKKFGGTGDEYAQNASINCTVDAIYISGYYTGTATFGSTSFTSKGDADGFLIKIKKSNGATQWAKTGGGLSGDNYNIVRSDAGGNAIVLGSFDVTNPVSSDFTIDGLTTGVNFTPPSATNHSDLFIVSYDINGNFRWQNVAGGTGDVDLLGSIEVRKNGEFYLVGSTGSTVSPKIKKVWFGKDSMALSDSFSAICYLGYFNANGSLKSYISDSVLSASELYTNSSIKNTILDSTEKLLISGPWAVPTIAFKLAGGAKIIFTNVSGRMVNSYLAKFNPTGCFEWARNIAFTSPKAGFSYLVVKSFYLEKNKNIYVAGTVTHNPYKLGSILDSSGLSGTFVGLFKNDNSGTELMTWSGSNTCATSFNNAHLSVSQSLDQTFLVNANTGFSCSQSFGALTGVTNTDYLYNFSLLKLITTHFTPKCAASQVNISWNALLAGPFGSSNLFKVYLSDKDGNFSNSTLIASTTSFSYLWTIPTNIIASKKYRIKIISTDPILTSRISDEFQIFNPIVGPEFRYTSNCINKLAEFKADTMLDGQGIVKWNWDFGDGSSANNLTIPTVAHTYSSTGSYVVVLSIVSSSGCTKSLTKTITIGNPATPYFTYRKNCLGLATEYISNYYDPSVNVTQYDWDFGDGTTATCTAAACASTAHTYSTVGSYTVTLQVTLSSGCIATHSQVITIINLPPKPVIISSTTNPKTCVGNRITLKSSVASGYDFFWHDANGYVGTNSAEYNFTVPHTFASLHYTLTLHAPKGCMTGSDTVSFRVYPLYSNIASSGFVICPGNTVNIFAINNFIGQSYYWQLSTDNGLTWNSTGDTMANFSTNVKGWYRCLISNAHCSEWSNTIEIKNWTNSNIIGMTGNLLEPDSILGLMVDNVSGTLNTIQWFHDGIPVVGPGNFPLYAASAPGKYYAISNGVCGLERTNEYSVFWNSSSPWNTTYQSGGTITTSINLGNPSGYKIGGLLIIDAGGSLALNNTSVLMEPCAEIVVKNGGKLTINGTILGTSDYQNWKRILVLGVASEIHIINGSQIWNADYAVICEGSPIMEIANSQFGNNGSHLANLNFAIAGRTIMYFNKIGHIQDPNTTLNCNSDSGISGFNPIRGVGAIFTGNSSLRIEGNMLYQNKKFSNPSISVAIAIKNTERDTIMANQFLGFYDTALSIAGGKYYQLWGNIIKRPHEMLNVLGNNVFKQKTAIYCAKAEECNFNGNRLENWSNGIEYYRQASSAEPNTVFESNKFLDNKFGLVVADVEHPVSASSTANNINNPIKVWTECNLFDGNDVGMIGSGDIVDQGTSVLSAGNRFQDIYMNDLNTDWGVLWQDNNTNNVYNFKGSTAFDDPKMINIGTYFLNGTSQTTNNLVVNSSSVNLKSCSQVISRGKPRDTIVIKSESITLYPNPTKGNITIESGVIDAVEFVILNSIGQCVGQGELLIGKNNINLDQFKSGFYIFKFSNGEIKKVLISE